MSTVTTNVQLSPATVLVQLLAEHPELPEVIWHVGLTGVLDGHMHGPSVGDFDGLAAYADLMGGSIRPKHTYTVGETTYRSHELRAVWRDVTVLVSVGIAESAPVGRHVDALDVSVGVLTAALAEHPMEALAYREAAYLVEHPEAPVATLADYPDWVMPHAVTGGTA